MRLEQHEIADGEAASLARVQAVDGVLGAPVHRRRGRVHECRRAQAAPVRLLAGVDGHMVAQALHRQKGAGAVLAAEGAVLLVRANVLVQDEFAGEATATDVAGVPIVFDVGGHVLAEQAALQEGGRAVFAFERSAKTKQREREAENFGCRSAIKQGARLAVTLQTFRYFPPGVFNVEQIRYPLQGALNQLVSEQKQSHIYFG